MVSFHIRKKKPELWEVGGHGITEGGLQNRMAGAGQDSKSSAAQCLLLILPRRRVLQSLSCDISSYLSDLSTIAKQSLFSFLFGF